MKFVFCNWKLHHSHSRVTCRCCRCLFRDNGYYRFCCQQSRCNTCCVLKSTSCNLCRIKDSLLNHIDILLIISIKSCARLRLSYFIYNNCTLKSRIFCDLIQWSFQSFQDDVRTCLLIAFKFISKLLNFFGSVNVR